MNSPLVLSTKTLPNALRERIVQNGLAYMEYNAIRIQPIAFETPVLSDYVIFSSQNATKAVLNKAHKLQDMQVLCVGKQSEKLLLEHQIKPLKTGKNMSELVDFIQNSTKKGRFLHFCGNRRLPLLAKKMAEWNYDFNEVIVYKTGLAYKKIEGTPDGILFFSPSGVESHEKHNHVADAHCFCIGSTTASAFKQTPKSIHVVKNSNVEEVVAKAIHHLKISHHA